MDAIERLFQWGADRGVIVDGISAAPIPGQGFGMVATRDIQKGQVVMSIPLQATRTLESVPESLRSRLPDDISIHGLLAAELALAPPDLKDWANVAPTLSSFNTIPYFWKGELQDLLPEAAKSLLQNQRCRINKDWGMFKRLFPDINKQDYFHAWFLIGTRAFYYETDETLLYPWHDRLALVPVADLFNHAVEGCHVSFSSRGYVIVADRDYSNGEQVCNSYGEHSNDFLLAEYGFLLKDNRNDQVCLDKLILPRIPPEHLPSRDELKGLVLSAHSKPCEKTNDALRLLHGSKNMQSNTTIEDDADCQNTALLNAILTEFLDDIVLLKQKILASSAGESDQREVLMCRWKQIEAIVKGAIHPS